MLDLEAVWRLMVKYLGDGDARMADLDATESDALGRLEAALDRIAARSVRQETAPETAIVAARLDTPIGQIRDALEPQTATAQGI